MTRFGYSSPNFLCRVVANCLFQAYFRIAFTATPKHALDKISAGFKTGLAELPSLCRGLITSTLRTPSIHFGLSFWRLIGRTSALLKFFSTKARTSRSQTPLGTLEPDLAATHEHCPEYLPSVSFARLSAATCMPKTMMRSFGAAHDSVPKYCSVCEKWALRQPRANKEAR